MSTMLKIFSDKSYLPQGMRHVVMLHPFWGRPTEDLGGPDSSRYDEYAEAGASFFRMTATLPEADIAVAPAPWEDAVREPSAREQVVRLTEEAASYGKPVALFFWSDSTEAVPMENATVFRTSLYRSQQRPNEYAMPAWSEDFLKVHLVGQPRIREKSKQPVVGFCGYAEPLDSPIIRKLPKVLRQGLRHAGVLDRIPNQAAIRTLALETLAKTPEIRTNFVIRKQFLGGALQPNGQLDHNVLVQARQEFVQNMVDSDYILCARGNGNFSYRLYETLSCGRIPVFIDTDCVLPYQTMIDWKKYCVWVNESQLPAVGQLVAEFHERLSPQEFVELQRSCRSLWEQWLSPRGFFANFYRHFNSASQ